MSSDELDGGGRLVVDANGLKMEIEGTHRLIEQALDRILAYLDRADAKADARPMPQPMDDEATVPSLPNLKPRLATVAGRPATKKRRRLIRLHAIDGNISKVYPIKPSVLNRSPLSKAVDFERIGNIYIDDSRLTRNLRDKQHAVWHAILPNSMVSTNN